MNYKVEVKAGSNWDTVSDHWFATLDEAQAFVDLFNASKHQGDREVLAMVVPFH